MRFKSLAWMSRQGRKTRARKFDALWAADGAKKDKVVVVSDIHLGILDKFSENVKNRSVFIGFLKRLEKTADVGELVIAGDFLDEWYLR